MISLNPSVLGYTAIPQAEKKAIANTQIVQLGLGNVPDQRQRKRKMMRKMKELAA